MARPDKQAFTDTLTQSFNLQSSSTQEIESTQELAASQNWGNLSLTQQLMQKKNLFRLRQMTLKII
jgi:hypothetical protein